MNLFAQYKHTKDLPSPVTWGILENIDLDLVRMLSARMCGAWTATSNRQGVHYVSDLRLWDDRAIPWTFLSNDLGGGD